MNKSTPAAKPVVSTTTPHNMKRVTYDVVKAIINERMKKNPGKKFPRMSESSLRLDLPIDPRTTQYSWNILENETTSGIVIRPEEIRLNINDLFFISDIAFYIRCDLEYAPDKISSELLTYSMFEWDKNFIEPIEPFYNGRLDILVDKVSKLGNQYDLMKHKFVPRTQFVMYKESAGLTGVYPDGYAGSTIPSVDFKNNGFVSLQPMIEFSGSRKNQIIAQLPGNLDQLGSVYTAADNTLFQAAGFSNNVAITLRGVTCITRGVLVQNFANFQH